MNIFVLDSDPAIAAKHFHNRHVVKMVLESAQLLSTARRHYGDNHQLLYKVTHFKHPCNIWLRESLDNYLWLLRHFKALCDEYTFRYGKIHKSYNLLPILGAYIDTYPRIGLTKFALAMPDCYKEKDPIQSYRNYYIGKKIKNNHWTNRAREDLDEWLSIHLEDKQFKVKR